MNYKELSLETWKQINAAGDIVSGYRSTILKDSSSQKTPLHLFRDEKGFYHLVIETEESDIQDPLVNGLKVSIQNYRLGDGKVKRMVDLCCSMQGYLEEFTGLIKEIVVAIVEKNERPVSAVNRILFNWKAFWAEQNRQMLSEEEIIGLICELLVLNRLCKINVASALASWVGPLKSKNDFSFTAWELEIKATRHPQIVHTINGLEQLNPSPNKSLGFVSFLVSVINMEHAVSLPNLIDQIRNEFFTTRLDLAIKFNELLAGAGYNPSFIELYRNFKIEIQRAAFYNIDNTFPKLVQDDLVGPLNNRISKLRYDISLNGISGKNLDEIKWGDYFY